ncbi:hypothetical protein [Hufsiella ginkgonis]|uniref:Uncharacterized protein n=1 Tax=Hufsiella ginkgonis TaxID=2695274 RepID=A0A7K1XVG1_9SPHI|nr:hypothetical protein [Hufsiella ginkgonis]MXV14983.1 hypothetical protein [Hufsiella ginkgonis]
MTNNITKLFPILAITALLSGCSLFGLDVQKDYDYKKVTLDPHINVSAKQFMDERANGTGATAQGSADTIFRWMKKGLEYAGIDLAEYEKSGRTFIFLTNDAIRVRNATTGVITAGLWFTYPIVDTVDPLTGLPKTTHPARSWSEYTQQDVKNMFLYLIGNGEYNFEQLSNLNTKVQSLLPAASVMSTKSTFGYTNAGKVFDQAGVFYLKLQTNADLTPIIINNGNTSRSAGYIATNGPVHVWGAYPTMAVVGLP